jgi:hypothetical protein
MTVRSDRASARRILRKRTKGWRLPAGAVCVSRPGRFGNIFDHVVFGRALAVDLFRRWLSDELTVAERASTGLDICAGWAATGRRRIIDSLPSLRGRDLACWCPLDQPCHADVLLELANRRSNT